MITHGPRRDRASLGRRFRIASIRRWMGRSRKPVAAASLLLALGAWAAGETAPDPAPGATAAALRDPAQAVQAGDPAALARIAELAKATTSGSGRFVQRTSNPGREQPEVRDGRFAFAVPDRYDLVWTRADLPEWRQRQCSDGEWRWEVEQTFADTRPDVVRKRVGDGDAEFRRVMACMRGDLAALEREFSISAQAVDGGWQLALAMRAEAQGEVSRARITLDAEGRTQRIELELLSGARVVVEVVEAQYGIELAPERFRVAERD